MKHQQYVDNEHGLVLEIYRSNLPGVQPCRRSHRLRGMLENEPGPAAAPVFGTAGVNDLAAAAAAAAGGQLWELRLVRRHAHAAVAKAAADLEAIPVDGAALSRSEHKKHSGPDGVGFCARFLIGCGPVLRERRLVGRHAHVAVARPAAGGHP